MVGGTPCVPATAHYCHVFAEHLGCELPKVACEPALCLRDRPHGSAWPFNADQGGRSDPPLAQTEAQRSADGPNDM